MNDVDMFKRASPCRPFLHKWKRVSWLNEVYSSPSFSLEQRTKVTQEQHYVLALRVALKNCLAKMHKSYIKKKTKLSLQDRIRRQRLYPLHAAMN